MFIYNKATIWEFDNNNNDFIKVEIYNNVITCLNKTVLNDIQNKLKVNIIKATFYVSVYDYELKKSNYFWDTIKILPIEELPIYFKNKDLNKFLDWLNTHFNNDQIQIYETSKFTKRKFIFDSKETCKETIKWEQTNYKFPSFNQLFYHAGDYEDLERYAYLYFRTEFNKINSLINDEIIKNVYNKFPITMWNKYNVSFESIKNTMIYMMDKMKKGILVGIKNNKLMIFLPFSKHNYINDFYTELYFDDDDKKTLKEYEIKPNDFLKKKLQNKLNYYLNKYRLPNKNILLDREKWTANDCFFKYENYEGDKAEAVFEDFLVNLCENRKIPDCIFIMNLRDHPVLHKDLKDSYTSIVNRDLDEKYKFKEWCPIVSVGPSHENADIPFITQDDWLRTSKKIYPDDCGNGYIQEIEKVRWEDKYSKAVFRGSATGCEIGEKNLRIKATLLSKENPKYLDAGIISFNRKLKKNLGKPLQIIEVNNKLEKSNFMTLTEKAKHKYILNLDGHVAAFRLGHEFSLGSVILIPKSKYYLWFTYLLKPFEHYIPINEDLSDLIEKIKWCISNDDKCKIIAENGLKFFNTFLNKDGIFDYTQQLLYQITPKTLNFQKFNKKIAIVTIYRNDSGNTRLRQKRLFLYWINKLLNNICNYDIITVEQSSGDLFNIGKLKNIGFDYLVNKQQHNYDNVIFTDIDIIPDSDLLEYYFKITDSLNSLANFGTRYEYNDPKTKFTGALVSATPEFFKKLNGYPNNFWGWGDEDVNILLRLSELSKPLYANKKGRVIDLEEINYKKKNISEKIDELNINKLRETNVYEKNVNYKNFRDNGLSNLNYDILYDNNYKINDNNIYHIIVDLKLQESQKLYPNDYFFKEGISKNDYKQIKNKSNEKVTKIWF
jgi:hypothetical protein